MKKFISIGASALALIVGMSSCSKEKIGPEPTPDVQAYMAVTLDMPVMGLRANDDGQDKPEPDSNYVGKWAGKDKIETVAIYMVPTDGSAVEKKSNLDYSEYYNEPTKAVDGSEKIVLTPKKGIEVSSLAGKEVKVYVLLNANIKAIEILDAAAAANFETEYQRAIEVSTGIEATAKAKVEETATAGGKLAKKNGSTDESIMMSSIQPNTLTLQKGVTEQEAITGVKNQAKVEVERIVARVMVTIAENAFKIFDKADAQKELGEIKDITYVIAQGERKVFISRKAGDNTNTWLTPASAYIPTTGDYNDTAAEHYDYASLWVDYDALKISSGTPIPKLSDYSKEIGKVTPELQNNLAGKFLLPNTHKFGTRETSGYKKGNTPYILVRGTFVPKPEIFADFNKATSEGVQVVPYEAGKDFYVGTNGKFYTSPDTARDPQTGGVKGMQTNKYVKGKVLYFAWLNPDKNDATQWLNSPVVRNNIYHVHISGFKSIGVNWNPLVPDPTPDTPENPNNPDPNPNEPGNDPKDNPIKPEDPLSNDETYMSVEVTVLPWLVHTYSIQLGF